MKNKTIVVILFLITNLTSFSVRAAPLITFKHFCLDADSECRFKYTGASDDATAVLQIKRAFKKVKLNRNIHIRVIDPIQEGDKWRDDKSYHWNLEHQMCSYQYGAWIRGRNRIDYAEYGGGCPNSRLELEKVLRRIK